MKNFKPFYFLIVFTFLLTNCSKDETIETIENTNPGPFSVTILETRMDGANIGWTQSIDNDNDSVTYSIYLNTQRVSNGGSALAYNFTDLNPETNYEGYVMAEDGKGGTKQVNFTFKTDPDIEEENIDNPDLELIGGQGAFKITPGSGIMSGDTSVELRINFDDFNIQIPNDSLDYRIEWKTNGVYGGFTDGVKEASISDMDSITYTSTNTETGSGEEKFIATLYSRPKGTNEEFAMKGSALTNLTISNDPKKKFFVVQPSYYRYVTQTGLFCASTLPPGEIHSLNWVYYVEKIPNAISYSLETKQVTIAFDNCYNCVLPAWTWNKDSTEFVNSDGQFELPLGRGTFSTCREDSFNWWVTYYETTVAYAQLTVTLE